MENDTALAEILKSGGVAVVPTDTLYGLLGRALNATTVLRMYSLKGRRPDKPCIILISEIDAILEFGIEPTDFARDVLHRHWPNPLSVVLPSLDEQFAYLHRGTHSLAFRMPKNDTLLELLEETGPLVAPSANPEGEAPAHTIAEAQTYFGSDVDAYIDGGVLTGEPSTLISLEQDRVRVLREGAYKLS